MVESRVGRGLRVSEGGRPGGGGGGGGGGTGIDALKFQFTVKAKSISDGQNQKGELDGREGDGEGSLSEYQLLSFILLLTLLLI